MEGCVESTMKVAVCYFGLLKDAAHCDRELLDIGTRSTVAALLAAIGDRHPAIAPLLAVSAVAINRAYASAADILKDGDEVAILPPVSGGLAPTPNPGPIELTRDPIPTDSILAAIKDGPDGAVVLFDGIVRDNTRARQTMYLVYEAYEAMALDQMRALVAQAKAQFSVREIALIHRLGRLEIGETSVLIVVASAHRAAAFDACRFVIDTLKKTVPIWKKEHFVDGAVWADGEPFPAEVSLQR